MERCTLADIMDIDKEFLTPKDVAPYLGCNPYSINLQADRDISKIGFKILMMGRRVRIPKITFIKYFQEENTPEVWIKGINTICVSQERTEFKVDSIDSKIDRLSMKLDLALTHMMKLR